MARNNNDSRSVLESASCIARIQSMLDNMTQVQRRIGHAVLADPHAMILASITELAATSNTSEAAVSRFARVLGYSSYAEFKLALSRDLIGATEAIHEDVAIGDPVEVVMQKVAAANSRAIEDTCRGMDLASLEKALEVISTASRLAFFGYGGSGSVARDARHHFLRTNKETVTVEDSHEQIMWATTARPGDVILLFSHTGATRDLCDVAEVARARGATIISVTNLGTSPLTKLVDINLFTSSRETRYREESMSSRIAALTLIDILFVCVSLERSEEQAERRQQIRQAISRKRM